MYPEITYFIESREQAEKAVKKGTCQSRGDYLNDMLLNDDAFAALYGTRVRLAIALNEKELKDDTSLVDVLRVLSTSRVPIDMWVNLSDEEGYWIHAGNIDMARQKIFGMLNLLEQKHVGMSNVGLDLEMPIGVLTGDPLLRYAEVKPWRFSQTSAQDKLSSLVEEILKTKYGVKTYEIPMIGDWAFTRRALGIPAAPEIESDKYERIGMVYTSVKPPLISPEHFIQNFSKGKKRTPAIGIVSANDENPGRALRPYKLLTNAELLRDVRAALMVSPDRLHVFAMNGVEVIERVHRAVQAVLSKP